MRRPSLPHALAAAALVAGATPAWSQQFIAPQDPPTTRYVIDATLDTAAGLLGGTGTAVVRNVGARELPAIALEWSGQGAEPFEVTVGGATREYQAAPDPVVVVLPTPLRAGAELTLRFRFRRRIGELDRGWGIQRWFPRLWWGYDTHATYDVALEAPADVIVGASARPDARSGRYRAEDIRTFGLYFARGFQVAEIGAGPTLVRSIYRADMAECARLVLETAADAVSFYRERFGTYPQPSLTIIPGVPRPQGGYPYATAIVVVHGQEACADRPRDSHWRWIAAHEVGHQYWLEHVLEKEPEHGYGWLMIGLGIWSDREWARARGLDSIHPGFLDGYADAVREGRNTTVEIAPEELRTLGYDYNTRVTHYKGFGIVSALAAVIGREAFERLYRRALREYAGRRLGSADFRRMAEVESGQDLGWFFEPLLRTNGFASYEVDSTTVVRQGTGSILRVHVTSAGSVLLPVPLEARFADGNRARRVLDRLRGEQILEFPADTAVAEVVVDPDREFPLVVPPPEIDAARLARIVEDLPWTGAGLRSLRLYRRAVELGVDAYRVWLKLGLTSFDGGHYEEALDAFGRTVTLARDVDPTWYFGGLVWCGMVNDLLGRRDVALERYRQALEVEGDHVTQHSQFNLRIDRAWVEQRLQTPFRWP